MWRRRKRETTSGVCRDCSQLKNVMGGCSCDGTCQGCGVKRNERGGCGCTSSDFPTLSSRQYQQYNPDEAGNNWMASKGYTFDDEYNQYHGAEDEGFYN